MLIKVVSRWQARKYINFLSPQKHLQGSSFIPEEGSRIWIHTKPELVIEPEEMDFERLERPNAELPKVRNVWFKKVKRHKLRLVEVSQRKWCGKRKELDAFVELDPVASHRGGRERGASRCSTAKATTSHSLYNQSHSHNRFRQSALMSQEGPLFCNSSSIS